MKRVLIVASGLRGIIGHNFFYTQTVQREFERRGFEVTVFANKHAPTEFIRETNYNPVFSLGTYDFIPLNSPLQDLRFLYLQSGIYSYELQAKLREFNGQDFDIIFCHTVADFELIAWNNSLKKQKLKGHLFVMQRNTPQFPTIAKWKKLVHPFYRIRPYYLNSLYRRMKGHFTLLTDSDLLSKDYANVFPHKIVTAPIPLEDSFSQNNNAVSDNSFFLRYNLQKKDLVDFGYLGDSRNGKGFSLLPSLIEKIIESKEQRIRFVIQCPNSEYDNTIAPPGLTELQKLAQIYKENLILINERLSEADYLRLFKFLDVIMIPYTSPAFIEGTSNIFTEAIALGKTVIVSNNTWMSSELKKSEGGLEFEKGNVDDFAEKTIQIAENYGHFAKKAIEYSPLWREKHSVEKLVDLLLKEANLS